MKRKRIKKYQSGGFTPGTGFTGTNVGKGVGAFGGMAGGLIENADMADGRLSTTGALGSGALKGASMGMAFGPVGALLGAGLGMAGGLMKRDQVNAAEDDRLQAIRDEERLRANMENQMKHQQMNQVLDQFPVKGNNTPRFAMGGPTGGGFDTSRMMVPRYAEGAGADAMPSFDFYTDGEQVSAKDYIAGLPQGQSINDHSQYWTSQLMPQFDRATQTWSNTGQSPMAQSAYSALQKHTPKFAMGGPTGDPIPRNINDFGPQFVPPSLPNDRLTSMSEAQMLQNEQRHNNAVDQQSLQSFQDTASNVARFHTEKPLDAIGMDLAVLGQIPGIGEPFDLLNAGISGARSMYNAAIGDTAKAQEQGMLSALSATSAIPFVGNATGATRLAHGAHKLAHGAHKIERGVIGAKGAKAATFNGRGAEATFAMGGTTMGPGYEVEGGEMMQTKGETPQTYGQGGMSQVASQEFEVQGPRHGNGGVKANDNQGARVYSDKLRVDDALLSKLSKL